MSLIPHRQPLEIVGIIISVKVGGYQFNGKLFFPSVERTIYFFGEVVILFVLFKPDACIFYRSEEHTSELQSRGHLVCRLLLEKKKSRILDKIDVEVVKQ